MDLEISAEHTSFEYSEGSDNFDTDSEIEFFWFAFLK